MSFVLETERLFLRPFAFGDEQACPRCWAIPARWFTTPARKLRRRFGLGRRFRLSFLDRGVGLLAVC